MTPQDRLSEIEKRLNAAKPIDVSSVPDHVAGFRLIAQPTRGFELGVNLSLEHAQFLETGPRDLRKLLQCVKVLSAALDHIARGNTECCLGANKSPELLIHFMFVSEKAAAQAAKILGDG